MSEDNFSYALANPLEVFLDKPAEDFQRADLFKIIEHKQIEHLTFHYTALDGKLKELKLPVSSRNQAERILAEGERVDGSSLFKGLIEAGLSDLYVVPLYKTAFLNPFDNLSLDFICRYLNQEGKQACFTPDNILAKASDFFRKSTGLELHCLGELEFFVISEKEPGLFPLEKQGYHEASPFIKSGEILAESVRFLTQITGAVKYAHSENGYVGCLQSDLEEIKGKRAEQLEVEFQSAPVAEMADYLVLGKWLIRNVAYRHGCVATFAPKIEEGVAGNGLHFHIELKKKGENVMMGSDGKLSEPARRLIGGLCEYASSLTAFGNTVPSSYLRLVPDQEAPTQIFWSDLNREALVRVPLGWSNEMNLAKILNPQEKDEVENTASRQTVELRSPDGSAFVHLLLAGVVMAAEWGFKDNRSLEIAKKLYVKRDDFVNMKNLNTFLPLPNSCVESSRFLLKNRELYEREGIFPPEIIDYVAKGLKAEDDEEVSQKLQDLPEGKRLPEARKIMHRYLHIR